MTSLYPRSKTWSITCQKMLKNIKVSPEAQDDVLGWLRGVKKKGNSHFTEADPVWYLITNQWTVAVLPDWPVLLYEHNCRYKTARINQPAVSQRVVQTRLCDLIGTVSSRGARSLIVRLEKKSLFWDPPRCFSHEFFIIDIIRRN